jgi:hypothetical protein
MISRISQTFAANRLVVATGVLDLLLTVALIPTGVFPHAFDKNAPTQLLVLSVIAVLFGALIIKRRNHFVFTGKIIWAVWFTVAALFASALMSPDFIGSMTGDTGRFTGAISALCLIIVAIFHSGFTIEQFKRLIWLYIGVVVVTRLHCRRHRIPLRRHPSRHRHQPSPAAVLSITFATPIDGWLLRSSTAPRSLSR